MKNESFRQDSPSNPRRRFSSRDLARMLGVNHEEMLELIEKHKLDLLDDEPMVQRLRGIPVAKWSQSDRREEEAALRTSADDLLHRASAEKWLVDTVRPLAKDSPNTPVSELIKLLPEPERSIAHDIVFTEVSWSDLPVEKLDRHEWHSRIEQAVQAILMAGRDASRSTTCWRKLAESR